MRKPQDITIDRVLLLYVLQLAETQECSMVSDVKLQQLVFLSELQMFGKGVKGFHYEFMRFAYGTFSKDLDNDLLALRRKERLENFSLTEQAVEAVEMLDSVKSEAEVNEQILEIIQSVVKTYAPQDLDEISKSVDNVEISSVDNPDEKLSIRDISFHSILLVPTRIEVTGEFTLPPSIVSHMNAALGL